MDIALVLSVVIGVVTAFSIFKDAKGGVTVVSFFGWTLIHNALVGVAKRSSKSVVPRRSAASAVSNPTLLSRVILYLLLVLGVAAFLAIERAGAPNADWFQVEFGTLEAMSLASAGAFMLTVIDLRTYKLPLIVVWLLLYLAAGATQFLSDPNGTELWLVIVQALAFVFAFWSLKRTPQK
jgi:hypothetical protein